MPHSDILAYCLMPNHFHLMVLMKQGFDEIKSAQNLRTMLSSYTRGINLQEKLTGSLFQQNTKAKCLSETDSKSNGYALTCFHYIHQNPLVRKLVTRMEDWKYSSFREYIGLCKENICNIELAKEILGLPENIDEFYRQSYDIINEDKIKNIF